MAQLTRPSTTESAAESLPWNGIRFISFSFGNKSRGLDGCFHARCTISAPGLVKVLQQPSHAYIAHGASTGCFFSDGNVTTSTASCSRNSSTETASPSACRAATCLSDAFDRKNFARPFVAVTFSCVLAEDGGRKPSELEPSAVEGAGLWSRDVLEFAGVGAAGGFAAAGAAAAGAAADACAVAL
eukprot:2833881-Prymnesium_polylepis.1